MHLAVSFCPLYQVQAPVKQGMDRKRKEQSIIVIVKL